MAGFSNVPPASEFRKYTSWGRTRQPKNIAGAHGAEATASATAPSTVNDGYVTENQRFLHVLLKDAAFTNGVGIVVWAYSHAFGSWGKLTQKNGSAATLKSTSTSAVQKIFEITGVDRVYFQQAIVDTADDEFDSANDEIYAACSTF